MKYSAQSEKKRPSAPKVKKVTALKKKVEKTYTVEKIISKRLIKGKWEYFVKWMDFPESDNTWEPEVNFRLCREMIDEYETQQGRGRTESVPAGIISRRPGPASATGRAAGSSTQKEESIKEVEVTKDEVKKVEDDILKLTDDEDEDLVGVEDEEDLDDDDTSLKENLSEDEDSSASETSLSHVATPTVIPWVAEMGHLVPVAVKGVLRANTNELTYYMELEGYPNKWIAYPAPKAHKECPELLVEYLSSKIVWVTSEQQQEE